MSPEEVKKILNSPEAKWRSNTESPVSHSFVVGYEMLRRVAKNKIPEQLYAEHDIIYSFKLEDLPGLEEMTVKEMGRLGWHFNEEHNCFAYFV